MKSFFQFFGIAILFFTVGWFFRGSSQSKIEPLLETPREAVAIKTTTATGISPSITPVPASNHGDLDKTLFEDDATKQKRKSAIQKARTAFQLTQARDPKDAARIKMLFKEALELDPKNQTALEQFANYYMLNRDFDSALPLLKQCLENYPNDSSCNGNYSSYFSFKNDADGIDQSTKQCLENDPQNMMCLNNRGTMFLNQKNYKDALNVFLQMKSLEAKGAIKFNQELIYEDLAACYSGLGNQAMANDYYKLACNTGNEASCQKVQ